MQRWIVAGVVAVLLFGGGGMAAYYKLVYNPNRPAPFWVPMPINPELPAEKRDEIIKHLKTGLGQPERLAKVSKDVGLVTKWGLPSDEACAAELGKRLFVKEGDMDMPMGKVPAIHVGLTGKRKESKVSEEIVMRLMDDVWKVLGIDPPGKKQ